MLMYTNSTHKHHHAAPITPCAGGTYQLRCTAVPSVGRCVAQGATKIIVAPYFLSRGRHIQDDIPAIVAEAKQQHPDITCHIAEPIGEEGGGLGILGCFA